MASKVSDTVAKEASKALLDAETTRKQLLAVYSKQDKVDVYLSPMYRPYFGNVMRVSINGISIFFKVDGTTQKLPSTFADEVTARRMAVDNLLNRQNKMASIANNYESSPGELALV